MRGFLSFILKHHFTLIFLVLQILSFILIISFNHTHKTIFINSSNSTSGFINTEITDISSYFSLAEENRRLIIENSNLRNQFLKNYKSLHLPSKKILDSIYVQNYKIISGNIIQSSVSKIRNFITLDIGRLQGVKKGSGVISSDGIVGIVKDVSDNYSVVIPVINTDFRVSCRINRNQYYGSLSWDALSYRTSILQDIPFHVPVELGDSLFTTGFSSIFPTGELVGLVKKVEKIPGENFFSIIVELSVDFKKLRSIYVVDHLLKSELDSLNNRIND